MDAKLNINQWAEEDRPREKLMQQGASALSNAELLAILIGSGNNWFGKYRRVCGRLDA